MVMRTQREIRQRAPLWLTGLLIANVTLMILSAHQGGNKSGPLVVQAWMQALFAPVQGGASGLGGIVGGGFRRVAALNRAAGENEELKRQLAAAETELRETRALRDENERLKSLLGFKDENKYGSVAARVIARDTSEGWNTVLLNCGRSSGG